jgi:S1-C subfamily serine protease
MLVAVCLASLAAADDYVLLVGCTEYPHLKEHPYYRSDIVLYGPANDVELMRDTLCRYIGVPASNLTILKGWPQDEAARPTRANILGHLERLAGRVKQGDRVIVHLAGHGSQQPDDSGDELDGLDEIFLPADVKGWNLKKGEVENSIPDDELGLKVGAIRDAGAQVWLLMDCCHAGTMVRAPGDDVRSRRLDPAVLGVPAAARGQGRVEASPLATDLTGVVAMYGAQSHARAPELRLPKRAEDARWHGLFSYTLAAQLRRTGGGLTFRELLARMIAAYQSLPFHGTVPVAEGDLQLKVGGGGRSALPPLFLQREGDDLVLNAGRLAGLGRGTVLAVYRPGQLGEPDARLGSVEIATAGLERSTCRPVKRAAADLPQGPLPVAVVSASLGDYRLRLAVVNETGAALPPEAAECFRTAARRIAVQAEVRTANWILVVQKDGTYQLRPVRAGGRTRCFEVENGQLESTLNHLFRTENLKRLAGSGDVAPLPPGLHVQLTCDGEPVSPGGVLRPGGELSLRVQNATGRRYDVTILLLDSYYRIVRGFPPDGRSVVLRAADNQELPAGSFIVSDDSLGIEHQIVIAVPREENDPVIDLCWLARRGFKPVERSGFLSPVEELFRQIASDGTQRGAAVVPTSLCAALLTWRTDWGTAQAPRIHPVSSTPVLRPEGCAALVARRAREAWRPAEARVRLRGGATVYRRAAPAVVVIRTRTGHGTGFLVKKTGLVLTNHHVVADGFTYSRRGRPVVQVHRGDRDEEGWMHVREEAVPADVVLSDEAQDLALLKLRAPEGWFKGMSPIRPARKGRPRPGEDCFLLGHPASGMLWSLREGRVAKVGEMPRDLVDTMVRMLAVAEGQRAQARAQLLGMPGVKIILTTCAGNPGDSGSPLLDGSGRLLGITYAIPRDLRTDKFVYHIHADVIRSFLEREHEKGPAVPDAWRLGPVVALSKSPKATDYDVVIAGTARPEQILIDVDGDTQGLRPEPAALREMVAKRTFDAEAAFHFLGDRRIAFYDTNNDGTFNLVLVDNDEDPEADVRFRHERGKWRVWTGLDVDWLKADCLEFKDGAHLARPKFRMLVQP